MGGLTNKYVNLGIYRKKVLEYRDRNTNDLKY